MARSDSWNEDLRGFVAHAAAYVLVNIALIVTDLTTGGGLEWAYWTFIPWGVGLLIHAAVLFSRRPRD